MLRTFALALLALAIYPGLLATGVAGAFAEVAFAGRRRLPSRFALPRGRPPLVLLAAALLGAIAAAQLPTPFSPADPADRNLGVAIVAVAVLVCLGWAWGPDGDSHAPAGLAGWAVALLAPAVLAQDFHPQVVVVEVLGGPAAVRIAASILYVASLPALLDLFDRQPPAWQRLWLWLPAGAFLPAVFAPAAGDDPPGLAAYLGLTAATLLVAVAVAGLVRQAGLAKRYDILIGCLAAVTVLIAVASVAIR